MNCFIIYIHDSDGKIKKQTIIDGDNEIVGKYIKSNVKEMYSYYMTIALNIRKVENNLNSLEQSLKKAFIESFPNGYKCNRLSKKKFVDNIKLNIKEIDSTCLVDNINTLHKSNNMVKVISFIKTLGKKSSIYECEI